MVRNKGNKMANTIGNYSAMYIPGLNKVAKMQPDDAGYYRCILGGFNLANQSGLRYPFSSGIKAMFDTGGIVRRRLDTGQLRGEYMHPDLEGMGLEQIMRRLALIELKLVSHHFRDIQLERKKDEHNREVILAYGSVKPSGPYGNSLEESLSNLEENVAFSVRSFSKPGLDQGRRARLITDVLTYDAVSEGGIKLANQYDTANLESIADIPFGAVDINNAIRGAPGVGLESSGQELKMVRDHLGWNKVEVTSLSFLDW